MYLIVLGFVRDLLVVDVCGGAHQEIYIFKYNLKYFKLFEETQ